MNDTHLSKYLSLVLRHDPAAAGVQLDEAGWVEIDALIAGAARHRMQFDRTDLERVVANNAKQRFAISPDGRRIRANQGHSIQVELGLSPQVPPDRLFHGTIAEVLETIRQQGLLKMSRQHVHLSPDIETAKRVGQRRGEPIILTIRAREMHAAGAQFYCSDNGVWLVDAVPPAFIEFP